MAHADEVFKAMCRDILDNGTDTKGEKVRPHWPDGTPAYTIKKFGVVNRYDLRKEFPILTLRSTSLKLCTDNGAMVAGLGYRYLMDGRRDDEFLSASARVSAFKKF